MNIAFSKYQGTGNDFILIDNRALHLNLSAATIAWLCDRRLGIGGDGLMLLQDAAGADFEMVYYNANGLPGSMCGNGGRCITQFAFDKGIERQSYLFSASDGMHEAIITSPGFVRLKMQDVSGIETIHHDKILNTGSPHYIQTVEGINALDVYTCGRAIRYNDRFNKEGINVNFVEPIHPTELHIRTYERGVEDETLSCGTGATAAALAFAPEAPGTYTTLLHTKGGDLHIDFTKTAPQQFTNIWLAGKATKVFEGHINLGD